MAMIGNVLSVIVGAILAQVIAGSILNLALPGYAVFSLINLIVWVIGGVIGWMFLRRFIPL